MFRAQQRQQVAQLRELDLNLSLARLGALREDVENDLSAVEDFQVRRIGQIFDLCGGDVEFGDYGFGAERPGLDYQPL